MKVALAAFGRLKNRYAKEWVEHHKQLGFNHIFIGDNNYDGEEYFEDILQQYIDEGFITIINYRNVESNFFEGNKLFKFYNEIYFKYSNNYDWIAFFDFDDFLILKYDSNINEYLSRKCFIRKNQILINRKTYTDNDLVYDDGNSCLDRFTTPLEYYKYINNFTKIPVNEYTKFILRTHLTELKFTSSHNAYSDLINKTTVNNMGMTIENDQYTEHYPINYYFAYIKYFPTKTIDEWLKSDLFKKCKNNDQIKKHIELFFKYNNITNEKLNYLNNKNINL